MAKNDISRETTAAVATALSFCAPGAALCVFNPHWSIRFIVLVQLYYAAAPGTWRR
jgi:hypothetical protein